MSLSFAIAIYLVIWWTVLFAILPIGVRTQGEDGAVVPGTPEQRTDAAAARARGALTTLVSALVFARPVGGRALQCASTWSCWLGRSGGAEPKMK